MIDTHLHILPGVDDGPETLEEALALARALVQEGVSAAIATPHYNDEYRRRSADEIRGRVYDVQQALDRCGIPLRLFAGHEVLIKPGLVEDIQAGRLATLNGGRYLLLFHDTHHRMITDPEAIAAFDLDGFDGVLAFGDVLREAYRRHGWGRQAFTWHEAADLNLFRPHPEIRKQRDLVCWPCGGRLPQTRGLAWQRVLVRRVLGRGSQAPQRRGRWRAAASSWTSRSPHHWLRAHGRGPHPRCR